MMMRIWSTRYTQNYLTAVNQEVRNVMETASICQWTFKNAKLKNPWSRHLRRYQIMITTKMITRVNSMNHVKTKS